MRSPFLSDWVLAHAEQNPDAPAIDSPEARLSYGDLAERMRVLSAHLASSGLRAGERVLIALPNLPATVVAGLAVHALGGCAVEINREWGADAFRSVLAQIRPRHAFVLGRDAHLWGEVTQSQPLRFWVVHPDEPGKRLREVLGGEATWLHVDGRLQPGEQVGPIVPAPVARRPDDPALILFTSGSLWKPRGVV